MTGLFDVDAIPTQPKGPVDPFLRTVGRRDVEADAVKVRRDARDTSRDAAARTLGRSGSARRRVFDLLAKYPDGLTDEEIQQALHMNPSTQRPRRVELCDSDLIRDSGQRRRTSSGSLAAVWVLTPYGREVAA